MKMGKLKHKVDKTAIEARIKKLEFEMDDIKIEQKALQRKFTMCASSKKQLEQKLNDELNPSKIEVTDHALIQFLCRKCDLDIDVVKSQLLPDDLEIQISLLGNGHFPIEAGGKVVVKNKRIITYLPEE